MKLTSSEIYSSILLIVLLIFMIVGLKIDKNASRNITIIRYIGIIFIIIGLLGNLLICLNK